MCSKPKPPATPNYQAIAQQQGQANLDAGIQTAQLSNPNMNTPYGSRTVTYDGNIPTINDTLSETGQQQFDSQNRIVNSLNDTAEQGLGRVNTAMATPFDMSKVQGYSVKPGVASYDDPIVKAMIERNRPNEQQRRSQSESDLLARGFNPGGSGYDSRMDDLGRQENDYRLAALLAGGQEQSRVLGAESSRRGQDIQEQAYMRNLPLSELNALRTGGQPGMPQFQSYQGANVGAAPLFDAGIAQGNFDQQNYQNQIQAGGGLFDLIGAGLGAAGAAGGIPALFGGLAAKAIK